MLKAEFRKTWSRPLIIVAFVLVCLAQVIYVSMNHNAGTKELAAACNTFGGQMDDTWRDSIYSKYEDLWQTPPQAPEDLWDATLAQRAVLTAYDYTLFTEILDSHVASLKEVYGDAAVDAYAGLRTASENGELVFGSSPAGESMVNQYTVAWGFLIFMIILCVDQFSGEKEIGMVPMQASTKQGRRKLFRAKLITCQLSALIVWAVSNLVYALTLTLYYGWGNLQSVIQDFSFNACPYNWNTGEFLAVTLTAGLLAGQLTALVIFLLARFAGSTQRSFALMGGLLVLPYLIAFMTDNTALALWLPCLLNNRWLWSGLRLLPVGGGYIPLWAVAAIELILTLIISSAVLLRSAKNAEAAIDT